MRVDVADLESEGARAMTRIKFCLLSIFLINSMRDNSI
jgi:hypothetical protein